MWILNVLSTFRSTNLASPNPSTCPTLWNMRISICGKLVGENVIMGENGLAILKVVSAHDKVCGGFFVSIIRLNSNKSGKFKYLWEVFWKFEWKSFFSYEFQMKNSFSSNCMFFIVVELFNLLSNWLICIYTNEILIEFCDFYIFYDYKIDKIWARFYSPKNCAI